MFRLARLSDSVTLERILSGSQKAEGPWMVLDRYVLEYLCTWIDLCILLCTYTMISSQSVLANAGSQLTNATLG